MIDTTFDYSQHLPGDTEKARAILMIKFLLFSASLVPSAVSGAIAYFEGSFSWLPFALLTLALFLGQSGGDYLYYYFTHFHTDSRDSHTKIFAGWKPLFVGSLLHPKQSLIAGIICLIIDGLIGIYFYLQLGTTVIYLAIAGGLIAVLFTPLMLKGFKEVVIFLTFGPLCILSGVYVLTGEFSMTALYASLPIGFFVTIVAYLKGAKFEVVKEGDTDVVMNLKRNIIYILTALAYLSLIILSLLKLIPPFGLTVIASVMLTYKVIQIIKSNKSKVSDYLNAVIMSLGTLILTGILISISFILSKGNIL
ncbi:prenyltransferase [Bacteroidetes/Chlorobi group bacterium ChocPot_Mid]|nr:MAG: prenyltransferase [Bacteroidetes/Chlorobi group bacterium ChocPot_Mid]